MLRADTSHLTKFRQRPGMLQTPPHLLPQLPQSIIFLMRLGKAKNVLMDQLYSMVRKRHLSLEFTFRQEPLDSATKWFTGIITNYRRNGRDNRGGVPSLKITHPAKSPTSTTTALQATGDKGWRKTSLPLLHILPTTTHENRPFTTETSHHEGSRLIGAKDLKRRPGFHDACMNETDLRDLVTYLRSIK